MRISNSHGVSRNCIVTRLCMQGLHAKLEVLPTSSNSICYNMRMLAGPSGLRQLTTRTKVLACRPHGPWPQHLSLGSPRNSSFPQQIITCSASASSSAGPAAPAPPPKSSGPSPDDEEGGIRFVYEPPRRFVLAALRKKRQGPPSTAKPKVDLLVEGNPLARSP